MICKNKIKKGYLYIGILLIMNFLKKNIAKLKKINDLANEQKSLYKLTSNNLGFSSTNKCLYFVKFFISYFLKKIFNFSGQEGLETRNNFFSLALVGFWIPIRYFLFLNFQKNF